jgi:hypothetical protein
MAINWNSAPVKARVKKAVMRGVIKGTEAVRNEAISLILNSPKTGRFYQHRSVVHQASAPGEPFASDTGRAVASIETRYDFQKLTGTVVATDPKFPFLEFGTQKMEPRPSLRPALANKQADIAGYVQDELTKEFG